MNNTFEAIDIIEGITEVDREEYIEAVQCLINSRVVWQLQGSYGRLATDLINSGECYDKGVVIK